MANGASVDNQMPAEGARFTCAAHPDVRVIDAAGPPLVSSYSLCITSMRFRAPADRRPAARTPGVQGGHVADPLEAQIVPNIVTELPGPKARVHIEFDHAWTSPSLPRAY